jgi:hypothetical protein
VRGIAELNGICPGDGSVTIGAATRHADVANSADVKAHIPALAALAGGIGDPAVRAMGTIGGSLANNDPAADYPAAALGLGATIVTSKREIAADDFFEGMFTTALEEDEIITAVRFPVPKRAGYSKFRNPASLYAMAGVFVADTGSGVRVAVTGAGEDGVFRSRRNGVGAVRGLLRRGARRRGRLRGWHAQRHPRHGGLPGEPRQGHGQARGGERGLILAERARRHRLPRPSRATSAVAITTCRITLRAAARPRRVPRFSSP